MIKKLLVFPRMGIILLIILFTSTGVFADTLVYQPSAWAHEKIGIATKAGIVPENFAQLPYTANITRLAYCKLLLNTANAYGYPLPAVEEIHPFADTEDLSATQAYMLGLTKGTTNGNFSPELPLTREMAAAMLSKLRMLFQPANFHYAKWNNSGFDVAADVQPIDEWQTERILNNYAADGNKVSSWARSYLADVYSRGIFAGVGAANLQPQGNITREQGVMLALNLLSYCKELETTVSDVDICVLPAPASIFIEESYFKDNVKLFWSDIPAAAGYDVTLSQNGQPIYTTRTNDTALDLCSVSNKYDPPQK